MDGKVILDREASVSGQGRVACEKLYNCEPDYNNENLHGRLKISDFILWT